MVKPLEDMNDYLEELAVKYPLTAEEYEKDIEEFIQSENEREEYEYHIINCQDNKCCSDEPNFI